ncbi:LOB domain-containing protein 24-like [Mercurialis annua]|uniref:LOB domain-containing protein 24-like n=1 Tax=Mercurialis annua TaxID=3986 RepID=UPI002160EC4C|nr:LOB domain-containing protein 24-like [Mercurialis annua]
MQRSAPAGNLKNTAPSSSSPPGCAACKHQRRKCPPDCILAPHFPGNGPPKDFENAHKLFGVSNMVQALKKIPDLNLRNEAAKSMVYQANARARYPVGGCRSVLDQLQNEITKSEMELQSLTTQIAHYGLENQELAQHQETSSHLFATSGLRIASTSSRESVSDFLGGSDERNKTVSLEFQDPTNYSKKTGE